jgi:hypothetical protein
MRTIFWILVLELICTQRVKGHPRRDNCVVEKPHHLTCHKRLSTFGDEFPPDIRVLELRNIEQADLDLDLLLERFPDIENVSIFGGNISQIRPPILKNKIRVISCFVKTVRVEEVLQVLQMVHVGVESIGNKFLGNFPNLQTLNLQGNYLQRLPNNFSVTKLDSLYLSGNRWNCSMNLDWVFNLNQSVVKDLRNITCFGEPHPNKPLVTIARFMKDLKKQCPNHCICSLPKVVLKTMGSDHLEPIIEVNCSYRGLTELPLDLPPKTKIIRLEGNEIEDLKLLKQDPIYRKALDLYLDNNKVKSIEELEGSYWLRHFRVFSLSGNRLTEIPTYALDNALEQNPHMPSAVRISLGGNPWRCDCVFTPVFQEMLQKFAPQIDDISEVKCSYVEGDENSLLPVSGVDVKTIQFQFVFFLDYRIVTKFCVQIARRILRTSFRLVERSSGEFDLVDFGEVSLRLLLF